MSVSTTSTHVLLAVDSPGLLRVLEHLLRDLPDVEVSRAPGETALDRGPALPAPDVIVTSARMMGRGRALSTAALRRACPRSRLIVITADREWWRDEVGLGAADASFDEEDVVRCLLPIVQILAAGALFPVAAD
jgi:DNA-binding NarL/FixJ family response regulator